MVLFLITTKEVSKGKVQIYLRLPQVLLPDRKY